MSDGYITQLTSGDEVVYEFRTQKQSDAMVEIAEVLIEERNLLDKISVPYSPGRRKSPLIDNVYEYLDGQEHEIGHGYYIDTLANRGTKKKNIERLAAECGLGVKFEGGW